LILVDTSVWVDHFRRRNEQLAALLLDGEVLGHPSVLGEVALGHLRRRAEILGRLSDLPQARTAADEEVLTFIERHALHACGVGWVDVHLLAAAALSRASLWTLDRRLAAVASRLSLAG
jgi:predicted nucleic acid-binding protein